MDARFQPTCSTFGSHLGSGKPPPLTIFLKPSKAGPGIYCTSCCSLGVVWLFCLLVFFPHHLLQKPVFVVPKMHQTRRVFFPHRRFRTTEQPMFFFFKGIYDFFTHTHKIELYIHINIYDCKSLTEDGKFRPITIFLYLNELPDNSGVRSPRMRLGIGYYTLQDQLT